MPKFTDETIIAFGIHKGKKLIDVPDLYLLFLFESGKAFGDLKAYIVDNLEAIKANVDRAAVTHENEDDE